MTWFREFLAVFGFEYTIYGSNEIKRESTDMEYKYNYYRLKIYNRYVINLLRNRYRWRGRKENKRYYPNFQWEHQ